MPHVPSEQRSSAARRILGVIALAAICGLGFRFAEGYLSNPKIPRPHDFLQIWFAGRLFTSGDNPYDGLAMYRLQSVNRMPECRSAEFPEGYASMMWVPPWGLPLVASVSMLPINFAQAVWGIGQLALIAAVTVGLWRVYGGYRSRWWVAVALAIGSGPVWWQTTGGQYAGLLLAGMTGYLAAHRANRPVLAGLSLTLVALKPHLLLPLAVGMLIDGRTPFGRRVLLGGAMGLAIAAAVATAVNPSVWGWYLAAAGGTGPGSEWYPRLADWLNPTIGSWVRHSLPGHPFWVQFLPAGVATVLFAAYWCLHGSPARWPDVLPWLIPIALITAPYGSWTSDMTLLLVPAVWVLVRVDAAGWPVKVWPSVLGYAAANVAIILMTAYRTKLENYVWVVPAVGLCLLCAVRSASSARSVATPTLET